MQSQKPVRFTESASAKRIATNSSNVSAVRLQSLSVIALRTLGHALAIDQAKA
jgi:hypothetical protein